MSSKFEILNRAKLFANQRIDLPLQLRFEKERVTVNILFCFLIHCIRINYKIFYSTQTLVNDRSQIII